MFFQNGGSDAPYIHPEAKSHIMPFFRYGVDPFRIEHVITIDKSTCLFFRHVVDGTEGESPDRVASDVGEEWGFGAVDGQGNGRFYKSHSVLLLMNLSGFVVFFFFEL